MEKIKQVKKLFETTLSANIAKAPSYFSKFGEKIESDYKIADNFHYLYMFVSEKETKFYKKSIVDVVTEYTVHGFDVAITDFKVGDSVLVYLWNRTNFVIRFQDAENEINSKVKKHIKKVYTSEGEVYTFSEYLKKVLKND